MCLPQALTLDKFTATLPWASTSLEHSMHADDATFGSTLPDSTNLDLTPVTPAQLSFESCATHTLLNINRTDHDPHPWTRERHSPCSNPSAARTRHNWPRARGLQPRWLSDRPTAPTWTACTAADDSRPASTASTAAKDYTKGTVYWYAVQSAPQRGIDLEAMFSG